MREIKGQMPPPLYSIWVEGREGGPLAEKRGFLLENGKCSFYLDQADARRKIWDLERLCLNRSSAVTYRSVEYTSGHDMNQRISLEEIKSHDLRPEFDPERYEIRSRVYGDTGGGCMVGTLEVYLSDLNKNVWVNCNDEGVTITSADYVWNQDHSASWNRYEDVVLLVVEFDEVSPEQVPAWADIIQNSLRYTIGCHAERSRLPFTLDAAWLPEEYREQLEPAKLERAVHRHEPIDIWKDGSASIHQEQSHGNHFGEMKGFR